MLVRTVLQRLSVTTLSQTTRVLLETMAGSGAQVGRTSDEYLVAILDKIELRDRAGVCLDAYGSWSAGYDIAGDLDGIVEEFDRVIGLDKLLAARLNDSKDE